MKSLYIHIPFCKKKCIYCDFYSEIYNFEKAFRFIEVICWQIRKIREKNFETIYIGGGTPSVLDLELLERLLKELYPLIKKAKEVRKQPMQTGIFCSSYNHLFEIWGCY